MKKKTGIVISDKMNKAAVVLVERRYRRPLYGKIIRSQRKIHVANEIGAKVGQKVLFVQTRPISKTIAFKIVEVVK